MRTILKGFHTLLFSSPLYLPRMHLHWLEESACWKNLRMEAQPPNPLPLSTAKQQDRKFWFLTLCSVELSLQFNHPHSPENSTYLITSLKTAWDNDIHIPNQLYEFLLSDLLLEGEIFTSQLLSPDISYFKWPLSDWLLLFSFISHILLRMHTYPFDIILSNFVLS